MSRSLHVRLDEPATAALEVLRSAGMNHSEAVRTALREAAARRHQRAALIEEVARLAEDDIDRKEMALIRDHMSDFAPTSD